MPARRKPERYVYEREPRNEMKPEFDAKHFRASLRRGLNEIATEIKAPGNYRMRAIV